MRNATEQFALTAIGTIPGRVSRPELCLGEVEKELNALLVADRVLDGAPVRLISVVIHLGNACVPPRVWGVNHKHGELEIAIGVPFGEVRRQKPPLTCSIIRGAALEALIAGCKSLGLECVSLSAAYAALRDAPGP